MAKVAETVWDRPWRPMSKADSRKAQAIAARLISRLDFVTDWRLQKAYFLAEVWCIEERLHRLSAADFASWTYGPWSLHVRQATEALEATGTVTRTADRARRRGEAEFLNVKAERRTVGLRGADREFLDSVADEIRYLNGDDLTKVAKATPPYLAAEPRHLIDLNRYLDQLKRKHARFAESPKVAALVAEAKAESS